MEMFSEKDAAERAQGAIKPFTLDAGASERPGPFDDEARQQAEADTAAAALSMLNDEDEPSDDEDGGAPETSPDQKKAEHEAAEAKRKAEWERKQAEKKAAEEKALAELYAMSDEEAANASVKRTNAELERLTGRNMKMCVTEHIQTVCLNDPAFARLVCHPRKSMINCFKYINRKARDYLKQEMEMNDEKPEGNGFGGDVPDGLCYQWAEEYYNDPDAEVDKEKEEKFEAKPYYGGSSSARNKKKELPKPKAKPEPKPAVTVREPAADDGQLSLFGGAAV